MPVAIAFLFFFSGVAALLYEVLWIREIGYSLGASSTAVAMVVGSYLGGLAIGAWLAGRFRLRAERGLLTYGRLELGIALLAPCVPFLYELTDRLLLSPWIASSSATGSWALGARFMTVFVIVMLPSSLMGATLPVLCVTLAETVRRPGVVIGRLYGLNTLGGMVGCLLAGFFFLERFGLRSSMLAAAGMNVILALAAFRLHRRLRIDPQAKPETTDWLPAVPVARSVILFGVLATSFLSIGLEIVWTRMLALAVGGTTYAFSLVLATFLLGLGLGSLVVSRLARAGGLGPALLGFSQLGLGLLVLGTMSHYDEWLAGTGQGMPLGFGMRIFEAQGSFGAVAGWSLLACLTLCLVPSLFLGISFPLLSELWIRHRNQMGGGVGAIYLVSTVGGVIGSTATAFVLLPRWGLENTMARLAIGSVVVAIPFLWVHPRRQLLLRPAAVVGLLLGAAFWQGEVRFGERLPQFLSRTSWDPQLIWGGVFLYGPRAVSVDRSLESVYDGTSCSVAIWKQGTNYTLSVNGKVDASAGGDMGTQLLLAYLPQLLHPDPQEVFVLGYGAGVTAGAAASLGSQVTVAEIEQGVIDASAYFTEANFAAHEHPQVDIRIDDGRAILRAADKPFHVITTEPSNPWMAGMSSLFTQEFYQLCKERMTEDGVLCQWVQLYWSSLEDYRAIAATLQSVFPHVALFRSTPNDTLMVASAKPLAVHFPQIDRRLEQRPLARSALQQHFAGFDDQPGEALKMLSSRLLLLGDDVQAFVKPETRRIRDDRPFLEFSAARRMQSTSKSAILDAIYQVRSPRPYEEAQIQPQLTEVQWTWLLRQFSNQFVQRDLLPAAEAILAEVMQIDPTLPGLTFQRWQVALKKGDSSARGALLQELVQREPGALFQAATVAHDAGQYQLGLQALVYLGQRGPKRSVARNIELLRGSLHEGLERWADALKAYELAFAYNRNDASVQQLIDRMKQKIAGG